MKKREDALRAMGRRPQRIWAPDTRGPGFVEECRRQAETTAVADENDCELHSFLDAALEDLGRDDSFG